MPDPAQNFVQQDHSEVRRILLEARTLPSAAGPKPGVDEPSMEPALSFESLESGDMPIAMARRAMPPHNDPASMVMLKQSAQVQQVRRSPVP